MIVVDQPTLAPAQCLVTKRADEERGPYIDLVKNFDMDHRGRMYLSRVAVETMAKELGLPSPQDLEDANERAAAAELALSEALDELESLREFEQSANYTLEHFGSKVRKKPGRKPAKKDDPEHEEVAA